MSKNQILFRVFLWIFLFIFFGSIIFAFLQGKFPENLDENIAYSIFLGFISSAVSMIFYAYYKPHVSQRDSTTKAPPSNNIDIPHGNFSGTIGEEWLPAGFSIIYKNAWQKPVRSIVFFLESETYHLDFGNGKVIIGGAKNTIEIIELKGDIGIIVRFLDQTKISFGY